MNEVQTEVQDRAVLVGIRLSGEREETFASSMKELANLADTAGAEVVGEMEQVRPRPDSKTYIGKGKVEELAAFADHKEANTIIFDQELSPMQIRNLEEALDRKVIDRSTLILDIFAKRARSREGMLQVNLAQMQYMLPRLTGKGIELSRQGGGIGARGAGEKKLEIDRRRIRGHITEMKRELEEVRKQRQLQRARRKKTGIPVVSLVGYTNAGKSSLFNAIYRFNNDEQADQVEAENKLFATLGTTTRQMMLPSEREFLLTDTVGFIQNLPHHLVAAFRSTLEEAVEADLIIHVVDASNPSYPQQIQTVEEVLKDLDALDIPMITVYNKVDVVDDEHFADLIPTKDAILLSTKTGEGLQELIDTIEYHMAASATTLDLLVPYAEASLMSKLHEAGEVLQKEEDELGWKVEVRLDEDVYGRLKDELERVKEQTKQLTSE